MEFQSAQYANAEQTSINATMADGQQVSIPATEGNRHYRMLIEAGMPIADYAEQPKYTTREAAITAMTYWASEFMERLTGPVPLNERLSWDAKEQAAIAYKAAMADAIQTALLQGEADLTGETLDTLSDKIIERATIFRAVVARVAGLRRKITAQLEAASTPAEYGTILAAGQTEAVALGAQLGF